MDAAWHDGRFPLAPPVLTETFRVLDGRMRFRIDRRELVLGPGEGVTIRPEEVH